MPWSPKRDNLWLHADYFIVVVKFALYGLVTGQTVFFEVAEILLQQQEDEISQTLVGRSSTRERERERYQLVLDLYLGVMLRELVVAVTHLTC